MNKPDLNTVRQSVSNATIMTHYYKDASNYVRRIFDTCGSPKPKLGILVGESGVGKTRICEKFKLSHPDTVTVELTSRTVVYIKLRNNASVGDIFKAIFFGLMKTEMPAKGTNADKEKFVIALLKDVQTKVIIIDEAHHAMAGVSNEHGRTGSFINTLKTLVDDSGVPILVVGLDSLKRLRTMSGSNAGFSEQLRRRSLAPFELKPLSFKDVLKAIDYYKRYLSKSDVECSILNDSLTKARLYLCSGGSIAVISDLIQSALVEKNSKILITKDSMKEIAKFMFDDEYNAFEITDKQVKKLITKALKEAA